jgi:hypothetical protein
VITAGPVGGDGWLAVFAAMGLVFVLFVGTGGLLAWKIARRWEATVLGVVAFVTGAWWAWIRLDHADALILPAGYAASALVGLVLRGDAEAERHDPDDDLDATARARAVRQARLARAGPALVGVVVVGLAAGTAWSDVSERNERHRTEMTISKAEEVGTALVVSDARSAEDLALVPADRGVQVLQAHGDRDAGAAELVVRVTHTAIGKDDVHRCWHYRLAGERDDAVPDPVDCPDVTPTEIASNYYENLDGALWGMSPTARTDLDAVRAVVRDTVGFYVKAADVDIEVAWLDDRVIGIAVKAGMSDCLVSRMVPDEVDLPFDPADTEVAIFSWPADRALLRSDQVGCRPALAAIR